MAKPVSSMGVELVLGMLIVAVLGYYYIVHGKGAADGVFGSKGGDSSDAAAQVHELRGNVIVQLPFEGTNGSQWSASAEDLAKGVCKINADDASCECGDPSASSCMKPTDGQTFTAGSCKEVEVIIPKGVKMSAYGMAGGNFSCKTDMAKGKGCYAKSDRGLQACMGKSSTKKGAECDSWNWEGDKVNLCGLESSVNTNIKACAYYFEACTDNDCTKDPDCR